MNTQELKQYIDRVLGNNIRCLLPSYWWKKLFGEVVDNIDSVSKSVDSVSKFTKGSINGLSTRVSKVEEGNSLLVDITYEELCRKKELGELIPGQSYRITDYECTINDEDPSISIVPNPDSINDEKFCIIVTALNNEQLSDDAKATLPASSYTQWDKKTSWNLKYTLENNPDKFSWARKGYKDYDVVISFVDDGNTINGLFFWDDYSNKYITRIGNENYYYLISSLDSEEPLQKTVFNYGDTVYVKYFGRCYEAKALYTSSMKDTGDGVLIECHRSNYTPSLAGTYPFVWDPISRVYKYKTAEGSYDYLFGIGKKDSFSIKERFSIKKGTDTFTAATKISNFDIIAGVPGNPFGYVINWNEELGRYTISNSYLGSSETDSTPLPKGSISVGDMIYIYDSEGLVEYDQIFFVNSLVPEDTVLLDYLQGLACIIFTWDNQEKIYSCREGTLVLEDGTPVGKDFDFSSNVQYGIMARESTSSSLGDYGLAVGFHVPEGKGVIYYMKDEYNNEAFYDFKNIMFSFPGKSPKKSFRSSSYCSGISIRQSTKENKFTLNKVVLDLPSNLLEHPKNVVISGDVYNQSIKDYKDNSYIGLNSKGELVILNLYDNDLDAIEALKQEVIDNEEVTAAALNDLNKRLLGKHESLIDGVTIKTFNGKSLLGEGDITFDNYFSTTSTNAVQNKVISGAIANLQYKSGVFEHGFESQYEEELGRNPADRYKVLLNYSNFHADATFADILFVRPESTEKRINFVTGMYLDSDNKLHVEYFYKGKCWERVESDSESGFEDIEVSYDE